MEVEEQGTVAAKPTISLRDYKYLDEDRLGDYLSSINPGVITDVTRKVKAAQGPDAESAFNLDHHYTFKVEAKHSFNHLYNMLVETGSLTSFHEGDLEADFFEEKLAGIQAREVVEITAHFRPSMVDLVDPIFKEICNSKVKAVQDVTKFYDHDDIEPRVPIVATVPKPRVVGDDYSSPQAVEYGGAIIFLAKRKFISGSVRDFEGLLAVCGKVKQKMPAESRVDMLDLLIKVYTQDLLQLLDFKPESEPAKEQLRAFGADEKWWRIGGGEQEREEATQRYRDAVDKVKRVLEDLKKRRHDLYVKGPAAIVTPLAAYT